MYKTKKLRIVLFLFALLLSIIFACFFVFVDSISCVGVPVLSEQACSKYSNYEYQDLSSQIFFNGEPAAIDIESSTIYLPQKVASDTKYNELSGNLELSMPGRPIFFKYSSDFDSIYLTVKEGRQLPLIIPTGSDTYMEYGVVLTGASVISLESTYSYDDSFKGKVCVGDFRFWDCESSELVKYTSTSSQAQWHVRGGSSAELEKKPWKISLKTSTGENKNLSLLGLGEDDDWILNPMSTDDTKIKEKLSMDLWNELTERSNWNLPMSRGDYVELIIDGNYQGLYLLQRRIDKKYLNLAANDVLLKGLPTWDATGPENAYEIIYSPLSDNETFSLMDNYWNYSDCSNVCIDNFVDVNLFLLLLSAVDNTSYKNMYYCLLWEDNAYSIYLVPWDTDLSFGMSWHDNTFAYDYITCLNYFSHRAEYDAVNSYTGNLDYLMAKRWAELRQNLFSPEHILSIAMDLEKRLCDIGAKNRDVQLWGSGIYSNNTDTVDALQLFIVDRISFLDKKFGYLP